MQKILVIAAFLAASLLTMAASAAEQAAKPTDPQIADIVYTANLLDIEAAAAGDKAPNGIHTQSVAQGPLHLRASSVARGIVPPRHT